MRQETEELLGKVCRGLVAVAGMVRDDTREAFATNDHVTAIRHFDKARKATETIKEAREALADIVDQMSKEQIPDIMRRHNVKTITVEDVGRVTISHRFSASMLDKEQGFQWLRANGHEGLITETVNSSSLSAFAKDMLENHGTELPEDIFKVGTAPYTSITKAK